jgi:hypothetical protein
MGWIVDWIRSHPGYSERIVLVSTHVENVFPWIENPVEYYSLSSEEKQNFILKFLEKLVEDETFLKVWSDLLKL